MGNTNIEKQEGHNSLLNRIRLAFEDLDPKMAEEYKDRKLWIQKEIGGKVYIRPPEDDKHIMLALRTEDPELYIIFNDAASVVTRRWDSFHQIGSNNTGGLTAWELWKKPNISDDQILEEVKKEMIGIASDEVMGSNGS